MTNIKEIKFKTEKELNLAKNMYKEKKAEWRLKEQDMQNQISTSINKYSILEKKLKDFESFMMTNKNTTSGKNFKNDLILLKDESCKASSQSNYKYLLNAIPGSNGKTTDDHDDGSMSFSEMSTKVPDRSKPGSIKKKNNPYKIEYFHKHFEEGGKLYAVNNNNLDLPTSHITIQAWRKSTKEANLIL
jgi:hypothetical protein